MKKSLLAITLASTLGVANASTFDMYDPSGALINVDATIVGTFDVTAGTWAVSSSVPFYGLLWNAHDGALYGEGTYSIDTVEGAVMNVTVGAGQLGGHILFDWGSITNIDVFNVWNINFDGSLSYADVPGMVDGPFPGFRASFEFTASTCAAVGYGCNSPVPIPAAVWLFGSGLVGLASVAKRKALYSRLRYTEPFQ